MLKTISMRAAYLLALSALLPLAAEAAPARQLPPPARADFTGRPSTVPDNYVPTPMGLYVSSQCVIMLPNDLTYQNNISPEGLLQPDGTRIQIPQCSLPRYNRDGTRYVTNGDIMDSATGNHDLLISAQTSDNTDQSILLKKPVVPLPVPTNIAGQTIYFTNAMSAGKNGGLHFVGFNVPGYKNTWTAGIAIADYYGNVLLQPAILSQQTPQGQWSTYSDKGPAINPKATTATVQQDFFLAYNSYVSRTINYYTNELLKNNTIFSIQTFGVTACDMLPPLDSIPGQYRISPFYPDSASVFPTVWSSGLCNMTASIDSGIFETQKSPLDMRAFTVKYTQQTDPVGRSAIITFKSQ